MDHKENPIQPEPELTPEEQLDLLLEKFLAEEPEPEPTQPAEEEAPAPEEEPAPLPEGMTDIPEEEPAPLPECLPDLFPEDTAAKAGSPEPEEADTQEEAQLSDADVLAVLDELLTENADTELEETAAEEEIVPEPITQEAIWEDQPVDVPVLSEEIGPDELIIAAAGLTHPEDLEFEKIMEETLLESELSDAEAAEEAVEEEEDFSLPDEYFLPVEKPLTEDDLSQKVPVYTEVDMTQFLKQANQAQEQVSEEAELDAATEKEDDIVIRRSPSKRRPKNSGTYGFFGIPHMITTVIWLALILFIGAGLGKMIWQVGADMLAFGRPNQTITITITAADDLDSIAQKLKDTGLIKYPGIFKFYGKLTNAETKVKPGTYELNTIYDYMALVKNMSGTADRVSTTVVIPEGYTCRQIFRLLEKSGVCTVEAMEEAVMNADLTQYWFLDGIDQSNPYCLEGYLFPDTYEFYLDHNPDSVLEKLLNTFNKRFSDAMVEKLDALNAGLADMMRNHGLSENYIQNNLFTMRELVIVASLIEKETSGDEESYFISSVIYNRLTNPGGETAGFLQIDATLVYINGGNTPTNADKEIDSPYNTYMYKGLPAGAICNPGLASLNAALSPEITEYYYYALDPATGSHKFFKTYKAHQNFLESLKKGD